MTIARLQAITSGIPTEKLNRIAQSHRPAPGRTALLVIDMQHGFLDPGASLEVPKGREAIPNIQKLLGACRSAKMPVIFTEFVYSLAVPCLRGNPFGPEHLPASSGEPTGFGTPSANCLIGPGASDQTRESSATVDSLGPESGELVLLAHTYDKFLGTPLELALRSLGIDTLIATGVTTDVCVNSTIISGANRNYHVIAAVDAMATIHDHIQTACFQIWANKFARLMSSDEIVQEIQS